MINDLTIKEIEKIELKSNKILLSTYRLINFLIEEGRSVSPEN